MRDVFRTLRRHAPRYLPLLLLLAVVALMLSGCSTDTPQNTFASEGEVANKQRDLFYMAMWPAIAVMIFVLGGIVIMCLRFRERDPSSLPPKQIEGNTRLELAWTIAPAILLLGLGIPTVALIYDLGSDPSPDAYVIDVEAQRYSFSFSYPDIKDPSGQPLFIPAEPHIPTGRQVAFHLHSNDVIHSFWIPRLGGKLDVIPNENNVLWLKAEKADTFHGECAEYCGLDHATMRMIIHADTPDDFQKWVDEQQAQLNATPKPTPVKSATPSPTASPAASPTATPSPTPTPTPQATGG